MKYVLVCVLAMLTVSLASHADDDHDDDHDDDDNDERSNRENVQRKEAQLADLCGKAFKWRTLDLKILLDGNAVDGAAGHGADGVVTADELVREAQRWDRNHDGCVTWREFLAARKARGYSTHIAAAQFNDHVIDNNAAGCRGVQYQVLYSRHSKFSITLDEFNNYQVLSIINVCQNQGARHHLCECRQLDLACRSTSLSHLPACTAYNALPTSGEDLKAFQHKHKRLAPPKDDKDCKLCSLCADPEGSPITKLVCGLLHHAEGDAQSDVHGH